MNHPHPEETQADYVSRFMAFPEAITDFPDPKQREIVGNAMYQKKQLNNSLQGWPKPYSCRFIEPGLVGYEEAATGIVYVKKEILDAMTATFLGKPVINEIHKDVSPEYYKNGQADGIVTNVYFNPSDGWYYADFFVWDEATKRNCENQAYSVSCAYNINVWDERPGTHNNIPYKNEVLAGEYTHLSVVANPRYEGARIIYNSKGGGHMKFLKFWKKDSTIKNASEASLENAVVKVDGKDVPVKDLIEVFNAQEGKKASVLCESDLVELDGKEMPLKNLIDVYRAKNSEDEEAKKKADEAKNAEEDEAKKKADEAKNAEEDEKKKKEMEAKNAAEGASHFDDLKNKASMRGEPQQPKPMSRRELAAEGAKKYGSK